MDSLVILKSNLAIVSRGFTSICILKVILAIVVYKVSLKVAVP